MPRESGPPDNAVPSADRMEPLEPKAITPGLCDWCGAKVKRGRIYCGPPCRVAYNNLLGRQGKVVMQLLKHWRKHRGAKDTPGEGKIGDVARRVDTMLNEDRARHAKMQSAARGNGK